MQLAILQQNCWYIQVQRHLLQDEIYVHRSSTSLQHLFLLQICVTSTNNLLAMNDYKSQTKTPCDKIPNWNSPQKSQNYFQFLVGVLSKNIPFRKQRKCWDLQVPPSSHNTETLRGSNSDSDSFCLWLFCLILQDFLETASTLFLLFSQTSSFKQYFHFSLLWGHRKPHPLTGASSARWGVKRRREALLPLQQPAGSVCQLLQLTLSLPSWPHATPGLADSFP